MAPSVAMRLTAAESKDKAAPLVMNEWTHPRGEHEDQVGLSQLKPGDTAGTRPTKTARSRVARPAEVARTEVDKRADGMPESVRLVKQTAAGERLTDTTPIKKVKKREWPLVNVRPETRPAAAEILAPCS